MKPMQRASLLVIGLLAGPGWADISPETVQALSAPTSVETRIGTLAFNDGVPTDATAASIFDTVDFTRALNAYNNSFREASSLAIKKGLQSIGAASGDVVIFEELMDSNSLFLTANADTIYYLAWLDLSKGPVVID